MKIHNTNSSLLLLFFLLINSCGSPEDKIIDQWGISFQSPGDWRVSGKENLGAGNYFLTIEKNGINSSGMAMFNWSAQPMEIRQRLSIFRNELSQEIPGVTFGDVREGAFGNYPGVVTTYEFTSLGLEHRTLLYCFQAEGSIFTIFLQGAVEDEEANKEGFTMIEETFLVKTDANL